MLNFIKSPLSLVLIGCISIANAVDDKATKFDCFNFISDASFLKLQTVESVQKPSASVTPAPLVHNPQEIDHGDTTPLGDICLSIFNGSTRVKIPEDKATISSCFNHIADASFLTPKKVESVKEMSASVKPLPSIHKPQEIDQGDTTPLDDICLRSFINSSGNTRMKSYQELANEEASEKFARKLDKQLNGPKSVNDSEALTNEEASMKLAQRLNVEFNGTRVKSLQELYLEQVSEEYARRLDIELNHAGDQIRIIEGAPIFTQNVILQKYKLLAANLHKPLIEKFTVILQDIEKIKLNSDVHVIDNYVFGNGNNIKTLSEIGTLYNLENPKLSLAEVGTQMINFVIDKSNKYFFDNYDYEKEKVDQDTLKAILTTHFNNMDNEIKLLCPLAQEIWSRAWTLALTLHAENLDYAYIKIIFDQAVEGHKTRGGCIQGRINRGFVGYATLLGKTGAGIFQ
jgi:hypothetical protein